MFRTSNDITIIAWLSYADSPAHSFLARDRQGVVHVKRRAYAQIRVIRINRWELALLIMVMLGLVLLLAQRPTVTVIASKPNIVKQGVTLGNRDFSGKSEVEARAMLEDMKFDFEALPVEAREDRVGPISYVTPELNGYELDPDMTWFRLASAAAGARVAPATRVHTPGRRMADYPLSAIRQGNTDKQAVGLLINVDWGEDDLLLMLPIMKRRGVKATFFVSGRWAQKHKHLLRQIADEGHEIASHGYNLTYGPLDLLRQGKLQSDIARSVGVIEEITGAKVRYYAPHKSEVAPEILKTAADLRLRTVLYSLDTVDWHPSATGESLMRTFRKAKSGDLILLHPRPVTARVLEEGLQYFQSQGLRLLTLTEMLSPEPDLPGAVWRVQEQ